MHEIFPFQQTHIFSPKKDHLFKKWDGGQLAFRASLGKSFLNFPNVFFPPKKLFKTFAVFEISPKLSHSHLKRFKRGILIKTFLLDFLVIFAIFTE